MEELKTISPAGAAKCPEHAAYQLPPQEATRRTWLFKVGVGLNALAGALVGVPILGYVLSGVFGKQTDSAWISLGAITDFPENATRLAHYVNPFKQSWDGQTADIPCWVRRIEGEKFQVFAINCTHLGCPIRWFQEARLFMCPCHGGVFYEDGTRASGPPPRGLFEYQYRVENGKLMISGGHLPTLAEPA
jgi:nitrite reductase/ring-hydroxylating ferredoxin subunit